MNHGERRLQKRLGTTERADDSHDRQVLDHLNEPMRRFVAHQEMMFLATSDARGECDNTFRAGPPGFVRVLDDRLLTWPEYRGNGVMASLGNIPRLVKVPRQRGHHTDEPPAKRGDYFAVRQAAQDAPAA